MKFIVLFTSLNEVNFAEFNTIDEAIEYARNTRKFDDQQVRILLELDFEY